LILVGSLTDWVIGIGPIALEPKAAEELSGIKFNADLPAQLRSVNIDPRELIDLQKMDWADPLHLIGSLFITLMSLYAWRYNFQAASQSVDVEPLQDASFNPQPRPSIRANSNGRSRTQLPGGLFARLRPNSHSGPGSRPQNRIRPMVFRQPKAANDQRSRSKRRRSRSKSIQFAVAEDHRCPYCLDTVTRNDPRGVKECEVCHTLHHADCWAITGVCQVPHLNT
jgi:hypothetical protein